MRSFSLSQGAIVTRLNEVRTGPTECRREGVPCSVTFIPSPLGPGCVERVFPAFRRRVCSCFYTILRTSQTTRQITITVPSTPNPSILVFLLYRHPSMSFSGMRRAERRLAE